METTQLLTPAERFYDKHKKIVAKYQKANPEKCHAKCKKYLDRIRAEEPEKYDIMKERAKLHYLNVTKPRRELAKQMELEKQSLANQSTELMI